MMHFAKHKIEVTYLNCTFTGKPWSSFARSQLGVVKDSDNTITESVWKIQSPYQSTFKAL